MDVNPDGGPHNTIKVEPAEETNCVLANSDKTSLKCLNDNKESIIGEEALSNGQTMASEGPQDVEVDIIKFTSIGGTRLKEADDPDATEYSSSFGNTESDNERCSALSEAEVESQYLSENGLGSTCDAFGSFFHMRKKKLTNHWRSFIHPLMWRCKWAELRIKEMESQALIYARELAIYDQNKLSRISQSTIEGFGSKSLPFSSQQYREKAMKRRKRKRVEDTTDLASFMSHHNLFSYLESKRSNPDGNSITDDFGNTVIMDQPDDKFGSNEDSLLFEFKDGENSLEQVLWKIEIVHSQIHKLRSQLDVVMSKNTSRISSSENLSLLAPYDAQTSSAPSPTFSAGNADATSVGAMYNPTQLITDYAQVLPESAISSYAETIHVPDIIESTVGLLSAADVTFHQPQIGDSCEDILDNILIHNDGAEGEQHTFSRISNQSHEKSNEPEKGEEGESANPSPIPISEPDPTTKSAVSQEQSTLKSCLASDINFPRNKRKRGERKAGPGSWSKKGSGEPDSQ